MAERDNSSRASRTRSRTERDLVRLHRAQKKGYFGHAVAMIGSVGWPIVGLALGGVLVGRLLDAWLGSHHLWTLMLLVIGAIGGCATAYHTLRGEDR